MSFLGNDYTTDNLPSKSNFEPLPAGWYQATISESKLTPTNDGTGQYIKIRYDILGPTHQGRVVFGNVNIKNKSTASEEIGRGQLGDIMRAIGLAKITEDDELIGGNLQIRLSFKPESRNEVSGKVYEATNEVRGWKSVSAEIPAHIAASLEKTQDMATKRKATPPWSKK